MTIFVPTEEYPKLLDWTGSATVSRDVKLLTSVCVCVCVVLCECLVFKMYEKTVCEIFFSFMLLQSYVYVGSSKFSPNTTDILTNITCYIVNNTLIKDATL